MRLECENPGCDSFGEVIFDDVGNIQVLRGPFHEGDRKSGSPVLCDKCGGEVEPVEEE